MTTINVLTLNEFLSIPLPPVYYRIKPLLPVGGFLLLVGPEKTFKSYVALNIGYSLACGTKVFNRFEVAEPCPVLYMDGEVGAYELRERGSVINVNPDVGGEHFQLVNKDMRIQLDTPEGILLLSEAIEKANPSVLIIDPIVEFHSADENRAIEMKNMMNGLKKIMIDRKMSLIMCHHTRKPGPFDQGNTARDSRGSYLQGAANAIINVTKPVKGNDTRIQLDFTTRSARKPVTMTLDFNEQTGGFE